MSLITTMKTVDFTGVCAMQWIGKAMGGVLMLLALGAAAGLLAGCDPLAMRKLKEGVSTEADVRDGLGKPDMVWDEPDGAKTLEYSRQPAGSENFMITIDRDGRMQSLRQVLTPENFARIQPGMHYDQARRILGKGARDVWYPLKQEHHFDWRFQADPNETRIFTVVTNRERIVLRTMIGPDIQRSDMYSR